MTLSVSFHMNIMMYMMYHDNLPFVLNLMKKVKGKLNFSFIF